MLPVIVLSVASISDLYSSMDKIAKNGFVWVALVLFGLVSDLYAGVEAGEPASEWSFKIAPYAWLAGTGGTIVSDGDKTDFDLSFGDIFEATTGGFQLNFEARYGRFFTNFDGTWATIAHSDELFNRSLEVGIDQTIIEWRGGYRVIGPEFRPARPEMRLCIPGDTTLDVYLGLRYWLTDIDFKMDFPILPDISVHVKDEWVEPLAGGRIGVGLTSTTALLFDGNVGAFGWGDAADLTWTLTALIDWRFGKHSDLALGWRTQGVEEFSGSGANRNGSEFVTTGPIIGYIYSF